MPLFDDNEDSPWERERAAEYFELIKRGYLIWCGVRKWNGIKARRIDEILALRQRAYDFLSELESYSNTAGEIREIRAVVEEALANAQKLLSGDDCWEEALADLRMCFLPGSDGPFFEL